ncbi:MAG: phosphoribosylglycinamide formyltransferase, partial [Ignavibacteriaceae bacterium]|nr:phosphoribosylglycinamide formyltransferase [Ignavibacteriaceae bacterium]
MLTLAVFVSGRGSNLRAVLDSEALKNLIEVKAVVGDKLNCPAFDIAKNLSIPVYCVGKKEGFISFDDLEIIFKDFKID